MITTKQRQVIAAMVGGDDDEATLCERFEITPRQLQRWCDEPEFQDALRLRRQVKLREAQNYLLSHGPLAARRLVALLGEQDKPDTVRRAALDILDRCNEIEKTAHNEASDASDLTDAEAREKLLRYAASIEALEGRHRGG